MTNASETVLSKPLYGEHHTNTTVSEPPVIHKGTMVLDLSCKRQRSQCSETPERDNTPASSPYRDSPQYLENKHETNNNDRGHVNSYVKQHSPDNQTRSIHANSTHRSTYECQVSKSPESRISMLTPPSDLESPKKVKLDSSPTQMTTNEMQYHADFQQYLSKDPVQRPISVPVSAQSVVPSVNPMSGYTGMPGIPYMPQMLPNLLAMNAGTGLVADIPTSTSPTATQNSGPHDDSKKLQRPFKAYPKDPLAISLTSDMMFDADVKQSYHNFRNRMLDSVKKTNEGTNIKMRRVSNSPTLPTSTLDDKDAAYWERRRKNNEAAKRSRDARRAKEDEIAIRAAFLEQEYLRLKCENNLLKEEIARMKYLYRH